MNILYIKSQLLYYYHSSSTSSYYNNTFYYFNISSNDSPFLFLILESCFHYSGGIIPFYAKSIATVFPSLFYNVGLCNHSLEGTILF